MFTNRRRIRIEWGDCDPAGIVYYPRYFALFDAATDALFEAAGFKMRELIRTYRIVGIPVVDVRAQFYIPSAFGDDVDVETSITKWGRSSFEVCHRLLRNSALAVEGFEKRVWVVRPPDNPDALKSAAIPANVIERFACGGINAVQ